MSLAAVTVAVAVLAGVSVLILEPDGGPDRLLPPPVAAPQMVSYDSFWRSDIAELTGPGELPVSATAVLPSPAGADFRVDLTGVPARVLEAYRAAADRLAREQPGCDLRWPLLAAIGQVESGHGTIGGAVVATDGRIVPEIIGVRLDGAGPVAEIRDTDGGAYDRDLEYDRAVGPMQFLPGTWTQHGADADGDGRADPHDIDDVALGAGRYLCAAAGGSLTDPATLVRAVFAYNRSNDYVRLVLTLAAGYAGTTPESLGVGLLPAPAPPAPPAPAPAPVNAPVLAAPAEAPAPAQAEPSARAAGPEPAADVSGQPASASPAATEVADDSPPPASPVPTPSEPATSPSPTSSPAPEATPEPSPGPSEVSPAVDPIASPSPTGVSPTLQP